MITLLIYIISFNEIFRVFSTYTIWVICRYIWTLPFGIPLQKCCYHVKRLHFMILQYAYTVLHPKYLNPKMMFMMGCRNIYKKYTLRNLKTWQLYWNPFIRFQKCRLLHMLTSFKNSKILERHLMSNTENTLA